MDCNAKKIHVDKKKAIPKREASIARLCTLDNALRSNDNTFSQKKNKERANITTNPLLILARLAHQVPPSLLQDDARKGRQLAD